MASFKRIKALAAAGENVKWNYEIKNKKAIWYSDDGIIIRRTTDPEIISMCRLYAEPSLNTAMIRDIIRMEPEMRLNTPELKDKKRRSIYELDHDPRHYIAFPADAIGEILALKKTCIYDAHLIVDKPVLVVWEIYKDMFFVDKQSIFMVMGLRRC